MVVVLTNIRLLSIVPLFYILLLDITRPVSVMIYFGYMLIATYTFFVLTGTIGFYACFWFTRLLYSSIKID